MNTSVGYVCWNVEYGGVKGLVCEVGGGLSKKLKTSALLTVDGPGSVGVGGQLDVRRSVCFSSSLFCRQAAFGLRCLSLTWPSRLEMTATA